MRALATKTGLTIPKHLVLPLGDGAPRWGGNHAPHYEHRDGLGFDIGHPSHFLPWLTGIHVRGEPIGPTLATAGCLEFRAEQRIPGPVWLTEKLDDGTTYLGALAEFAGERHGRFGALPDVDRAEVLRALGLIG